MMALSNKEDSETFEYIFKFINSKCDHSPTNCMADGDKAARIAAKNLARNHTVNVLVAHE